MDLSLFLAHFGYMAIFSALGAVVGYKAHDWINKKLNKLRNSSK